MVESQTTRLQSYIDRLKAGDAKAKDELISCACDRLQRLTRKMLKSYPGVARWEQTDDIFQNAVIRLCRALNDTAPESVKHFLNLAALHIRRELIDLARHHYGPQGPGAHHDTGAGQAETPIAVASETTMDPGKLAQWSEFHKQVEALPAEEREVFNILWYHGIPQSEAATLLNLSERTLQRRWQSARLKIFQAMNGTLPE
ncbi:MAG: sigma-70 family RNA polymerase sigma factor [Planctomycetes bacterium]|nr:sigma-70 family RNA polymerase sigma factor [Planctomycetota bacterium]